MISDHKEALEFLERQYPYYFSPMAIWNNTEITLMESTLGRKLRQDRKDGRVKSKRAYTDNGRYYIVYAWKKTQRGKK